jgi:hypothetical protein
LHAQPDFYGRDDGGFGHGSPNPTEKGPSRRLRAKTALAFRTDPYFYKKLVFPCGMHRRIYQATAVKA